MPLWSVDLVVDELDVALRRQVTRGRHRNRDLVELAALAGSIRDRVQRTQHDLFIRIERRVDRIDRDQRGQDRGGGAGGDEIADGDFDLADAAIHGGAHLGVVEIELCGLKRCFSRLHVGDGFAVGVLTLVVVAPRDHGVADELRAALELTLGEHDAGFRRLELRVGLVDLCCVRRRVDLEQDVTGLHQRAFGEVGRHDRACHTRAKLDAVDGLQTAGKVVPQHGLPRLDHRDGDGDGLLGRGGRCRRLG
ncbi:hypothetical protein ACVWW3_001692 [Bradyrhizobium sp. LM2.9]